MPTTEKTPAEQRAQYKAPVLTFQPAGNPKGYITNVNILDHDSTDFPLLRLMLECDGMLSIPNPEGGPPTVLTDNDERPLRERLIAALNTVHGALTEALLDLRRVDNDLVGMLVPNSLVDTSESLNRLRISGRTFRSEAGQELLSYGMPKLLRHKDAKVEMVIREADGRVNQYFAGDVQVALDRVVFTGPEATDEIEFRLVVV